MLALLELLRDDPALYVQLRDALLTPAKVRIGESVRLSFSLHNPRRRSQDLMVDFQLHFVKANGSTSAKVFKLKALPLAAGADAALSKKLSLAEMTTRKHQPGYHRVDALVNGRALPLGGFTLLR